MGCIHSDLLRKSPSKTNLFHRKHEPLTKVHKTKLFHRKQPLDLVYDDFTDEEYYSLNAHYNHHNKKVIYV